MRQAQSFSTSYLLTVYSLSFFLVMLPFPIQWQWLQPQWVLMSYIALMTVRVDLTGVGLGVFLGLMLDVLLFFPMGIHAVGFAVVGYVILKNNQRMHGYSIIQHALAIFGCFMLYQMIEVVLMSAVMNTAINGQLFITPIVSYVLWPWWASALSKRGRLR